MFVTLIYSYVLEKVQFEENEQGELYCTHDQNDGPTVLGLQARFKVLPVRADQE